MKYFSHFAVFPIETFSKDGVICKQNCTVVFPNILLISRRIKKFKRNWHYIFFLLRKLFYLIELYFCWLVYVIFAGKNFHPNFLPQFFQFPVYFFSSLIVKASPPKQNPRCPLITTHLPIFTTSASLIQHLFKIFPKQCFGTYLLLLLLTKATLVSVRLNLLTWKFPRSTISKETFYANSSLENSPECYKNKRPFRTWKNNLLKLIKYSFLIPQFVQFQIYLRCIM